MVPTMDQEAVEGAMGGTNDGSGSCRSSDGWYYRWIRKQSTMDQEGVEGAMDQEAVEGAMDQDEVEGEMDQEEVEGAMDQEAVEGTMDGTTDGSGNTRRSD